MYSGPPFFREVGGGLKGRRAGDSFAFAASSLKMGGSLLSKKALSDSKGCSMGCDGLRSPPVPGALLLLFGVLALPAGCATPYEAIDRSLAAEARFALRQERPPPGLPEEEEEENIERYREEKSHRSVLIGELLAIFPGFFWHGLGHQYAGDLKTAREIRGVGEWGYLLTALGGGLFVGGYFLDHEADSQWDPYALSLYIAGGIAGGVGAGFFLTAWFYDMIDTPRAVESGGKPPPRSPFSKDLEDFQKS